MNKKIASVIGAAGLAASLFFMGCGGSAGGVTGVALTAITGKLTDGPISNAVVQLATLKQGHLASATTDEDGNYTLKVATSTLKNMADSDLPYLYAESTASSQVMTNTTSDKADLVIGQVKFRSMLTAESLRAAASTTKTEIGTAEIGGLRIDVNTNARALIVESKLLAKGVLVGDEQLIPDKLSGKVIDDDIVNKVADEIVSVNSLIADTSTDEFKLLNAIGIATMQLVEKGNVGVFAGVTGTKALTNAAALLLEAVTASANSVSLDTSTFDFDEAKTKFAESINDSDLSSMIENVELVDVADSLKEDKTVAKYSFRDVVNDLNSVQSTYMTTDSSYSLDLSLASLDDGSNVRKYSSADSSVIVSFVHDGLTLKLNEINGVVFDADISVLKTGENTGIGATAAVTVTLSAPVKSVAGSDLLANGEFFKLEVSNGTNDYVLWLGSIYKIGEKHGLGLVGFENLNNSDGKFWLKSVSLPYGEGQSSLQLLPFTTSVVDMALPCGNLAYDAACTFEVGYSIPEAKVGTYSYEYSVDSTAYTTVMSYAYVDYEIASSGVFKGTRVNLGDYSELRITGGDGKNGATFRYAKDSFWFRDEDGGFTPNPIVFAMQSGEASPNLTQSTVEGMSLSWDGKAYDAGSHLLASLTMLEAEDKVGIGSMFMHPNPHAKPVYFKVNGKKYTPAKYSTTHALPTSGGTDIFPQDFANAAEYESWASTPSTTQVTASFNLSDGDYDVYIERTSIGDDKYLTTYTSGVDTLYFKLTGFDKELAVGKQLKYKTNVFEPDPFDSFYYRLRIKTSAGNKHFHWHPSSSENMFSPTGLNPSAYSYLEYVNYPSRVTATTATIVETGTTETVGAQP